MILVIVLLLLLIITIIIAATQAMDVARWAHLPAAPAARQ